MEGEFARKIRRTRIRKVGPYLLLKPIGKGSFSTVYEGKIENSVRKVAIKVISLGNVRKKDYERVQMQVKILSLIRHENIVELLDFKKSARHLYLIFQHCQNTDLEKHLAKYYNGVMPQNTVRKVFLQIKKAFQVLRLHRIVHRDLKLANILVTEDFRIRIADFGFAGLLEEDMLFSSCVGTPLTMAPEVLNRKDYDEKCDIWSLGIILYQLLQGATPFVSSDNMTLQALKEGILHKKITFDPAIPLSDSVKGLMLQMIVNDPTQRMSFEEFFRHDWLQEEVANSSCCLRQAVLQKQLCGYLKRLYPNQQDRDDIVSHLDQTITYKLLGHYKSNLENRIYSYVGLSKKLLSWKKTELNNAVFQKLVLLGLVIVASNIKLAEQCEGTFVIGNNKVKMPGYSLLKDIEVCGQSEFSKSLPLLLKKSKAPLREELTALDRNGTIFSDNASLSECYLSTLLDYITQGSNSDYLQSLIRLKLHDPLFRVTISSEGISKEMLDALTSPDFLSRMSQRQPVQLSQEFSRVYKMSSGIIRLETRANQDTDRQKLEQLYEAIRDLL